MNDYGYCCDICHSSYSSKKHLAEHLQTKKHKKRADMLIMCNICKKIFSTKANYSRHIKKNHEYSSSDITYDIEDDTIKNTDIDNKDDDDNDSYGRKLELLKVVYELKHKNEILEKDKVILKLEKELYKQKSEILEKNGEILEKDKVFAQDVAKRTLKTTDIAVKGLTYAKKYYSTAPELKKLDKFDLGDDNELIKLLLFYSRKGALPRYIGDFVIKFYKKNDPNDQSLWTTDIARLTFIVRQLLKNKADWRYDKKGIKVCNIIINPLLSNIKDILKKYNNDVNDIVTGRHINNKKADDYSDEECYYSDNNYDENKKMHEIDNNEKIKLVNDQQIATQIITDIDNKILAKDILKYISPHLSLVAS